MTAPQTKIVQVELQNEHASMPLIVPVAVICNTPDEQLERNIRANSKLDLEWVKAEKPHDRIAIMCGGGGSIADYLQEIDDLREAGGTVFAMNATSQYLRSHTIPVDWQVIADAKKETAELVDSGPRGHLLASQVNPETRRRAYEPKIWHLEIGNIERLFPTERLAKGGYALIGGGSAVGDCAMCLAYAMGYRKFHVFGYDSCHLDGKSHAYEQAMNAFFPVVDVEWAGKKFRASVAMKAQAEKFQITARALKDVGCDLHVYGHGLLQTMYRTPASALSERDKYRLMWQFNGYRDYSPGEKIVDKFLKIAKPNGLIVDFGCGTGRAALELNRRGYQVLALDFADNCRDDEALGLPFLECDLTQKIPIEAPFGYCTDVMEHIPTADVDRVLCNILRSAKNVFFQISTVDDVFGDVIGTRLHQTVQPHEWWLERFSALNASVAWHEQKPEASCFFVKRMDG